MTKAQIISKMKTHLETAKRKAFSLVEILVACAIIVALSTGAFFMYGEAQQTRKMAQMHSDMEAITTALVAYESQHETGELPTNLADVRTLSADDALDNVEHTLLTTVKMDAESANLVDPWGGNYLLDRTNRTLSCTPKDRSGNELTAVERSF